MPAERDQTLFARPDVAWAESSHMSAMESLMWRVEVEPRLRSTGLVCALLDVAPDWPRLVAAHRWAAQRASRLHQRVVEDPLRIGQPMWVDVEVDIGFHLRRQRLAAGQSVLEVAGTVHVEPFDASRPLWEAVLVEGMPGDKAAYLFKFNHAITDGLGLMQLFELLFSDRRESTSGKAAATVVPDDPSGLSMMFRQTTAAAEQAPRIAAAVAGGGRRFVRAPLSEIRRGWTFGNSLMRVAGAAPAEPSPLFRERGMTRAVRAFETSLADMRAAAKTTNGSVNDVFMAGICGGLRLYHERLGQPIEQVPLALPVSVRKADAAFGGNHFAGARIAGPVGEADPVKRVASVREAVRAARDEPALDFLAITAPVMSRIPTPVLCRLTSMLTRSIDLQASNVPGLRRAAFIAGARIERTYGFGPAPGPAGMLTLLTHESTCCFGITVDLVAIPDPDAFAEDMRAGFDEVLALASAGPVTEAFA